MATTAALYVPESTARGSCARGVLAVAQKSFFRAGVPCPLPSMPEMSSSSARKSKEGTGSRKTGGALEQGPLGDAAAAAAPTLRRGSSSAAGFTHGWRRRPSFRRPFARPFLRHIEAATSPIAVALQQMLVLNDNFIVTFKADHKTNMYT
jgi:hypothetical protein